MVVQFVVAMHRRLASPRRLRIAATAGAAFAALLGGPTRLAEAQETPSMPVPLRAMLVLPESSDPDLDTLLSALEDAYASMDVERWVSFFTDDVEQRDIPRRVHIQGKAVWRAQTERINGAHIRMGRVHHGRARVGRWVVVEIEWFGTVRGEAVGAPGERRSYRYTGLGLLELAGGKIRRQIIYGDVTTLNEQLRAVPDGR